MFSHTYAMMVFHIGVCMATCCIKDCEGKSYRRGMCHAHYNRMIDGRPMDEPLQTQHHGLSKKERFDKWWKEDLVTGCWMWQGKLSKEGYGQFRMSDARAALSHRASWILHNGEIPENPSSAYKTYYVCHKCDTPACVNPKHLFLGDQQKNMDDKMGKDRHIYGISRGVNHGNAKADEGMVREIRASTESTLNLSKKYGLSRPSIDAIRKRQTWKHVE